MMYDLYLNMSKDDLDRHEIRLVDEADRVSAQIKPSSDNRANQARLEALEDELAFVRYVQTGEIQ